MSIHFPAHFEFSRAAIQQYLAFGYLPSSDDASGDPLSLLHEWSRRRRREPEEVDFRTLVKEGVSALRAAFEDRAASGESNREQVVFLSGGLDSRGILGSVLSVYDSSQVIAATFGMPGELDYDNARRVARKAGVRHVRLETSSVEWSTEGLVDSILARQIPLPYPFGQRYLSYCLHKKIGSQKVFWDGLCGGSASGVFQKGVESGGAAHWDDAVTDWLGKNLVAGWTRLAGPDFDPRSVIPAEPYLSKDELSFPDQLDFAIRQRRYISTRTMRGYSIMTPYITGPWLDFILSVPLPFRRGQVLYKEILKEAHPQLFSLPLTNLKGGTLFDSPSSLARRERRRRLRRRLARYGISRGLKQPDSGANAAIRREYVRPGPIRDLFRTNLADLHGRNIVDWIDPRSLLSDEASRNDPEHGATTVLLGLELNLKANESLGRTRNEAE